MNDKTPVVRERNGKIPAAGGVVAAVLASSCCIGPLVLIALGASGPWIGNLTALKAYQPVFVTITLVFLAFGFRRVYGTTEQACATDSSCASPRSDRIAKVALWIAAGLVVAALTVDLWAPLFY